MRSILFLTLLILIAFIPVLTMAGPVEVPDEMLEEAVRSTGRFKGKVISREGE